MGHKQVIKLDTQEENYEGYNLSVILFKDKVDDLPHCHHIHHHSAPHTIMCVDEKIH